MRKISIINSCITKAISLARSRTGRNLEEPDYTAALTLYLPGLLQSKNVMPSVQFGGYFVHQRPKVSFKSSTFNGQSHSCELGDLLLLGRKHVDGKDRYNAVLLQFKRHESDIINITSNNELAQLELYTEWPVFTMNKTGKSYNIQPKTANIGAQYANIKENANYFVDIYLHTPQRHMKFSKDFTLARILWNFMNWETGRTINLESDKANEEWSKMIWDLIESTKNSTFTRKNIDIQKCPRSTEEFFKFITQHNSEKCYSCGKFRRCAGHEYINDSDEGGGISILYMDFGARISDER